MLDGFRKIRSETHSNLNSNDWWVFKHPHFLRGDEAALSLIKKSAHFVETLPKDEISVLKSEVVLLRGNVSSLSSRISELDNVVAYLMSTIQNKSVNDAVSFTPFFPGSTASVSDLLSPSSDSAVIPSVLDYHDDKKRKLKPEIFQIPTIRAQTQSFEQSNHFNSFPIDSFAQSTSLPVDDAKFEISNPNYYYAPLGDASMYRNSLSIAQTYYDEDEDVIRSESNDDIDFDALLEVTADDGDYFVESTPIMLSDAPDGSKFVSDDSTSHLSSRSSEKTISLYDPSPSLESKEASAILGKLAGSEKGIDLNRISLVINQLPTLELQNRFVDQLALSIGKNVVSDVIEKNLGPCKGKMNPELVQSLNEELDWHSKHGDAMLRATCNQSDADSGGLGDGSPPPFTVNMISGLSCGDSTLKTDVMAGATSLENNCPLVALGALLASVRLSSSEATENAAQVFSKSCANLKERMSSFAKIELPSLSNGRHIAT